MIIVMNSINWGVGMQQYKCKTRSIGTPKYKNLKLRKEKKGICSQLHIYVNTGPMSPNVT